MTKTRLWTKEEVDFAMQCLQQGMSAGVTAKTMNEQGWRADCGPITRNMIVGVWSRNDDYKGRHVRIPVNKIRLKKKVSEKIAAKQKNPSSKSEIPEDGLKFSQLREGVCRFPYGDPDLEPIRYCGHPVDYTKGRAYCTMHYHLCYHPPRKG